MSNDNPQNRLELIRSLASTIRENIVTPPSNKAEAVGLEVKELGEKLDGLEKELFDLSAALSRTRLLATVAALGVAVLGAVMIF